DRYRTGRIEDQVRWYSRGANKNRRRSRMWRAALVGIESAALVVGLLRIGGHLDLDLLGVLGTAGAGLVAWMQAKNYTYLAESYAVTSHEVGLVAQAVYAGVDEPVWAQKVHDAEAAFSREHTMWVARRQAK
ncbi:MAG: SLATT domain-containing protein, partial [Actinobacteria bacterium]|nr:SLATT domain-containing protein [Actinomycetota bacterium]